MGRLGEGVVVHVGTPLPDGHWHAATMTGTLKAGWDADVAEDDGTEDIAVFGFEEHGSSFFLEPSLFRSAKADGDRYLIADLGSVFIEVLDASEEAEGG